MIGFLQGTLLEKKPPTIIVDVHGLGYEVQVSMSTLPHLPEVDHPIKLWTHFIVREDAQLLYGFINKEEQTLFRSLIKINGVGPKMALTILSSIEPQEFIHCIMQGDTLTLTRLPGIGKKTAERLLVEMRDKINEWEMPLNGSKPIATPRSGPAQEALSALLALGYKPQEASRAMASVEQEGLRSEELIRLALRSMVQ